ncbi:MAG: Hsp33 family molecular chaperone HslO [Rhodospirillaceae bacterium]|nr:Hsp33 family molecular chaperone HslO [Rhodospirillaceae bacterium]
MTAETDAAETGDDIVQPFLIETSQLRGRLVRLGSVVDTIVSRHDYPDVVSEILAETIVVAGILASGLKYDGVFTLQTKGDGAVPTMVVDVTSDGEVRGYAKVVVERLPEAATAAVPVLLGQGHLAFTVDQGEHTQRYQGLVALAGESVAECIQHYMRQSDQLDSGIKVAVGRRDGAWRASGLMVQRLPDEAPGRVAMSNVEQDDWRRAMVLMGSATSDELLDPDLPPRQLLYRLFHEDGVRVYRPRDVRAGCRCSRERVTRVLTNLPAGEVAELKEPDGTLAVVCEFCHAEYRFTADELMVLARPDA